MIKNAYANPPTDFSTHASAPPVGPPQWCRQQESRNGSRSLSNLKVLCFEQQFAAIDSNVSKIFYDNYSQAHQAEASVRLFMDTCEA
ncbi:MAG: hypothetical protein PUD51_04755 [Prevotellaceae bacterium]|nr:hypothetical protein [Prevotellaceae bacterium]